MNRRAKAILRLALCVLVFAGLQWFDPFAWRPPVKPPAPLRNQYLTIRWPKGTQTVRLSYVHDQNLLVVDQLKPGEMLEKVRQLTGYEYCGTVADTIILRGVAPDQPYGDLLGGPCLTVMPDPWPPVSRAPANTNRQP
jgi:hypothetical protein